MNNLDLLVIAPQQDGQTRTSAATARASYAFDTPYGAISAAVAQFGARRGAWAAADVSPFAAIYAAKAAGATRVVELVPVRALNRLLAAGDLLLPDDMVDLTQQQRYTFFAGKGYGFLAQREPFCPVLRGALFAALRKRTPRSFARATYLATEAPPDVAPNADWDADIAGVGVVPASFLARELELCYAPVCVVVGAGSGAADQPGMAQTSDLLADAIIDALEHLPDERACGCATAMQQYRDRGDIGPDWRTWLG
jgi:5'-methylthioadenosine phosphorylase